MLCWKQYSVVNRVSGGLLLQSPSLQQEVVPSQQEVLVLVLEPTYLQNST